VDQVNPSLAPVQIADKFSGRFSTADPPNDGPRPLAAVTRPLAFSTVNCLSMAFWYGRAGRLLTAQPKTTVSGSGPADNAVPTRARPG
jgi:hypothetical protein